MYLNHGTIQAKWGCMPWSSMQNRATFEAVWGCSGPVDLSSEFPKMGILTSLWRGFSSICFIRISFTTTCVCCLSSFCCASLRSLTLCSVTPPLGSWVQEWDPPLLSLLYSRLNKHSLLSLFLNVMSCSPLNHFDGVPVDMLQFVSGILVLGSPKLGTLLL